MHLKSLILKGFKSFADKSAMQLEPGVTVVVGPNGSGKSNISDAVLWVLGEQSAKTLRGQAMEDVIFAGSSARQAVGVAEVDLVLDNSDGTLPLEFTEVTITRRMYRNGESEYLINNAPARLMDIQDLLHDSGLGRDTHSIISQGRLDEVLNSRPEDRRSLIEEAAGVLKHKKRKERALRKLTAMDAHLERARDISSEIDRQLRPLQRQANKAQEHAGLVGELRDLELALAVDDLRRLQSAWDELAKRREGGRRRHRPVALPPRREGARTRRSSSRCSRRRGCSSATSPSSAAGCSRFSSASTPVCSCSRRRARTSSRSSRSCARSCTSPRPARHSAPANSSACRTERGETDARLKALYGQLNELRREAEGVRKARMAADDELARITAEIRRTRKQLEDDRADAAKAEQALSAFRARRGAARRARRADPRAAARRAGDALGAPRAPRGARRAARRMRGARWRSPTPTSTSAFACSTRGARTSRAVATG